MFPKSRGHALTGGLSSMSLESVNGGTISYRDENGLPVAETMMFGPDGNVVLGIVSHSKAKAG